MPILSKKMKYAKMQSTRNLLRKNFQELCGFNQLRDLYVLSDEKLVIEELLSSMNHCNAM